MFTKCVHCSDIGIWILPSGSVSICPALQNAREHNPASPSACVLTRSINRVVREGKQVNAHLFAVAQHLAAGTSTEPVTRDALIYKHFGYTAAKLRSFHASIEELRRLWALPVGSRKEEPAGYWIMTEVDDFRSWVTRAKAAPVTQLSTIYHVARVNFPLFAEQLELEFWGDVAPT
jgi:hypothetical protein